MFNVLVVDDYEPLRFLKAHLLARAGFCVGQAASGQQALDLVAADPPDLVLLDLNLPDILGSEVCRRIKATSDVPVLLTSAIGMPPEIETLGDGCIVGVDPEDLIGPVRAISQRPPAAGPTARPIATVRPGHPSTHFAPAIRSDPAEIARRARDFGPSSPASRALQGLPCPVGVLDENRQFLLCNRSLLDFAGVADARDALGLRPGELLGCQHAWAQRGGCGTTELCRTCGAVRAVLQAQRGVASTHDCHLTRAGGGPDCVLDLRVSAAPFDEPEGVTIWGLVDARREQRRQTLSHAFFHDALSRAGAACTLVGELQGSLESSHAAEVISRLGRCLTDLEEEIRTHQRLIDADASPEALCTTWIGTAVLLDRVIGGLTPGPVRVEVEAQDVPMRTEPALLGRILGNMLRNAIEATQPGGTVRVRCDLVDGEVEFSVHNPSVLLLEGDQHLFEGTYSTKGIGRGMGTRIMKLLGECYLGGRIAYRSSAAEGTVFFARFPATH